MNISELTTFITQSINMVLGASMQGETSYTNSFSIQIRQDGFLFIPRMPASYKIDNELYQSLYTIANASLYPEYTLLKQPSAYFVPLNTRDIHVERALFFPWQKGIPERLVIRDLDEFACQINHNTIPVMTNLNINWDKVTSMAIAGNSGSGKSYALVYFLTMLNEFSDLIIVDPKFDTPSRWAKQHGISVIYPQNNRSKSDFVSRVNEELSNCLKLIYERQSQLFDDPDYKFKHYTFVIDEVLSLSEGVNRAIRDSFISLISQIALLGRATHVHLVLVSQRFDYKTIPVSVREQLNVLIQVGNITKSSTKFLFDGLDPQGIVIPTGKGTGLIQVIDSEHPYQVMPLLCPPYYTKREIL